MRRRNLLSTSLALLILAVSGITLTVVSQVDGPDGQSPPYTVPPNIAAPEPPEQPIAYSHKVHAGALNLDCQACHTGTGTAMTFPGTETCMGCHAMIATDSPEIQKLAGYHERGEEIPWKRVYQLRVDVTWSHQPHLEAGVACETCHGEVRGMEKMAEVTAVRAMATCIGCHEAHDAGATCHTCHSWPTPQDMTRWRQID